MSKHVLKSLCLGALMAACLCGPASSAPFEDGQTAFDRGDYAAAIQILRPLAEHGDARAQYMMGLAYCEGRGVPQDYAEAVRWYREAARQGVARARVNLGSMYASGKSVPQDYAEAISLWRAGTN